jgi:hypothetical protein
MMMTQNLIAGAVVLLAAAWLGLRVWRSMSRRKMAGDGHACGACPKCGGGGRSHQV